MAKNIFNIAVAIFFSLMVVSCGEKVTNEPEVPAIPQQPATPTEPEDHGSTNTKPTSNGTIITEGAVDLGLSVKWAACDLGATKCYDQGKDYEWGDQRTECLADICGTSYDQAYAELGGGWRLPTKAQAEELINKCRIVTGSFRGYNGYIITGPSENAIFVRSDKYSSYNNETKPVYFWTGTCDILNNKAYVLYLNGGNSYTTPRSRSAKNRIRPIYIY